MIRKRTKVRVTAGLTHTAWGLRAPAVGVVVGHEKGGNLVSIDTSNEPGAHLLVNAGIMGDGYWWFEDWQLEVIG